MWDYFGLLTEIPCILLRKNTFVLLQINFHYEIFLTWLYPQDQSSKSRMFGRGWEHSTKSNSFSHYLYSDYLHAKNPRYQLITFDKHRFSYKIGSSLLNILDFLTTCTISSKTNEQISRQKRYRWTNRWKDKQTRIRRTLLQGRGSINWTCDN